MIKEFVALLILTTLPLFAMAQESLPDGAHNTAEKGGAVVVAISTIIGLSVIAYFVIKAIKNK